MQENILNNWFNSRKISDDVLNTFKVHWGISPIMGECIVIPVMDHKGVFFFNKYRRDPLVDAKPKYLYDKGGSTTLYGYFKAKDEDRILITEGELDCLVAWSANIPAITSTGGALSFQEEWTELLKDKDITICFDNDEAGAKGMVKVLKYLPQAKVVFIPDRPNVKDLSDYVAAGGDLPELLRGRKHFTCLQDVVDDRANRLATWQSVWFHDAYIKEHTIPAFVNIKKKDFVRTDGDALHNAKKHPISNLIEFDYGNKTICLWHNEKTPSLHFYPKTNTLYCFGMCGRVYDVIDVYKKLNNCSFKEAVEKLK